LAMVRHRSAVSQMSPIEHSCTHVSRATRGKDHFMKSSTVIAGVILALVSTTALAQSSNFDARKFFDRLQLEGASVPANFDARAFFDRLQMEGASSSKPLSAEEFFERLRAEGASVPTQLDRKEFMNKVRSEGMLPPDVAVPNN